MNQQKASAVALAVDFPGKPVKIVAGFAPGQGVEPMPMSPAALSGIIKSQIGKWGKAAEIAGARAD